MQNVTREHIQCETVCTGALFALHRMTLALTCSRSKCKRIAFILVVVAIIHVIPRSFGPNAQLGWLSLVCFNSSCISNLHDARWGWTNHDEIEWLTSMTRSGASGCWVNKESPGGQQYSIPCKRYCNTLFFVPNIPCIPRKRSKSPWFLNSNSIALYSVYASVAFEH